MNQAVLIQYPAGSLLRVSQICRDPKSGRPGLVPWVPRTWLKKAEKGEIAAGRKIGRTRVWSIEEVLAVGDQLGVPAQGENDQRESLKKARAVLATRRLSAANGACLTLADDPPSSDQHGPVPGAAAPAAPTSGAGGPTRGPVLVAGSDAVAA